MEKKIAIVQSCYIPWRGYFKLISQADEFILYDDMQYTKRDWRNRNLIKTPNGLEWLSIPVEVKGKYHQKINEAKVIDKSWVKTHWKALIANYSRAPFFKTYKDIIEATYHDCEAEDSLSQINFKFLKSICQVLNIKTPLRWSTDYVINDELKKTERLVALSQAAKATHYISGPSAAEYMQLDLFAAVNMTVSYIDYSGYPPYPQLFGDYQQGVTILDLIFNAGSDAFSL